MDAKSYLILLRHQQAALGRLVPGGLTDEHVRELEQASYRAEQAAKAIARVLQARSHAIKARQEVEAAAASLREQRVSHRHRLRQLAKTGAAAGPHSGAVETEITDQDIEAFALKAVVRLSQVPADQVEAAWEAWRDELVRRLPPFAASEVIRRAEELRQLWGDAPDDLIGLLEHGG